MTHSLIPLDTVLLQAVNRLGTVRPWHLAEITGASPWHIRGRLQHLERDGLLTREVVSVDLTDRRMTPPRIRSSATHVVRITQRGADAAGPWLVPTYAGITRDLPAVRVKASRRDHTLAVSDLYAWYTSVFGPDVVATEREITSLEVAPRRRKGDDRPAIAAITPVWTTMPASYQAPHVPDLALVAPDGARHALELERAQKTVDEYLLVVQGYLAAGIGQVWHVLSDETGKRLQRACARIGQPLAVRGAVLMNAQQTIRVQRWSPGNVGTGGPETWRGQLPPIAPAGFDKPATKPDLTAAWKRGSVVDPERPVLDLADLWLTA